MMRRMELDIEGRTAVVTGATRGIGAAVAARLAAEGVTVVPVSRSEGLDVTAPDAAERIAERAGGPVDILVNNAGTSEIKPLDELVDADWYAAFELNVMAPLRLMRHFAPGMAERGWGRIVNVTSTAGKRPSQTWPAYSVAKAAQLSLSRLHADFWAARGVLSTRSRPARPARRCGRARADSPSRSPRAAAGRPRTRSRATRRRSRSAASASPTRSPRSSSSCAPSGRPGSPARPGRPTAGRSSRCSRGR